MDTWLIGIFIYLALIYQIEASCCPSRTISFGLLNKDESCKYYKAESTGKGTCQLKVCGDGSPVQGTYCGDGSCNLWGCHCEGGCRPGDAAQNFRLYYGTERFRDIHYV